MGLVAVVEATMVVAQPKNHKMGIAHTLNRRWVLQISLPAFHHNIVV